MRRPFYYSAVLIVLLALAPAARADKTKVEIEAPKKAKAGEEITVRINVSHHGNGMLHHTNWVVLKVNGKEVKKWEYSSTSRPEDEKFTLEYKLKVEEKLELEAEGNCNVHGSEGPAKATVELDQAGS